MNSIKKIGVVGAGALGTLVGALIKQKQPELNVVLLARGDHGRVMRERGLAEVRGRLGCHEVPITASTDPEAIADSDLILLTVKSQDSEETVKELADQIGNAIVVSLQNGINQHVLLRYLRSDRLLVGMTSTNMTITSPGVATLHRDGVSVIGAAAPETTSDRVEQARQTLASSGLRFESTENILGVQYNKLLFNTVGYASVMSASDLIQDGFLDGPWRRNVALALLSEGLSILEHSGITLERVKGGSDVIRIRRLLRFLNTPGVDVFAKSLIGLFNPPRLVFSVHHDLIRGRKTEIEYVNGEIVRLAKQLGIEAPCNAEVVRTVHGLESSKPPEFLTRDEVVHRFRQLNV